MTRTANGLKAVIFDMDGVLVDTEPLSDAWHVQFAREFGVEMALADLKACRGLSGPDMWRRLTGQYDFGYTAEEMTEKARYGFLAHLQTLPDLAPSPGVAELIAHLHEQGMKLAVASAASRIRIETLVNRFGIAPYLHTTVSFQDVTHSKPAPDIYLEAARRLDILPSEALVFEDSRTGIAAARAAGMVVLRYTHYVPDPDALHEAHERVSDFRMLDSKRLAEAHATYRF
jgi:HAD superfamily hydrolase (TIGR01509 family)